MKVLFIGGTGNISTACTRLAVAKGIEIFLLNRGRSPSSLEGHLQLLKGDIRDRDAVDPAIRGLETVFHEAARPSVARSVEGRFGSSSFVPFLNASRRKNAWPCALIPATSLPQAIRFIRARDGR